MQPRQQTKKTKTSQVPKKKVKKIGSKGPQVKKKIKKKNSIKKTVKKIDSKGRQVKKKIQKKVLEEEVPTSSTSWSGTLTSLLNTPLRSRL